MRHTWNEHTGSESPSMSGWTHVCRCYANTRSRVSLNAPPYQCFTGWTDTFFHPLSSALFSSWTPCPCLASGSHSLTWDAFPLRTAVNDAPLDASRVTDAARQEQGRSWTTPMASFWWQQQVALWRCCIWSNLGCFEHGGVLLLAVSVRQKVIVYKYSVPHAMLQRLGNLRCDLWKARESNVLDQEELNRRLNMILNQY